MLICTTSKINCKPCCICIFQLCFICACCRVDGVLKQVTEIRDVDRRLRALETEVRVHVVIHYVFTLTGCSDLISNYQYADGVLYIFSSMDYGSSVSKQFSKDQQSSPYSQRYTYLCFTHNMLLVLQLHVIYVLEQKGNPINFNLLQWLQSWLKCLNKDTLLNL